MVKVLVQAYKLIGLGLALYLAGYVFSLGWHAALGNEHGWLRRSYRIAL
jgi:hypothetical protein